MHLVVPYAAGLSEAGAQALHNLQLPHLEQLLSKLQPGMVSGSDEYSLSPPLEQVLAAARGWQVIDGGLPFAAWWARADGLPADGGDLGWGLLTPSFWEVGREQIVQRDPAELQLEADESRALLQAVRELFESQGWALHWGAPLRWYAAHSSLAELATASLERAIGRTIDAWLPQRQAGRQLRRLQSEVQMLLHTHPINEAREARGAQPVNSFWLSGTGRTQPVPDAAAEPEVDARLRAPLLAEDWAAWAEAWQTLDAQVLRQLQARASSHEAVSLTLCGERRAQRFDSARRGAWSRLTQGWRRVSCTTVLQAL